MNDAKEGSEVDLQKRGARHEPNINLHRDQADALFLKPFHGEEFFFSNVLMKVYQVPMLFFTSSEFPEKESESTFIVLVFEKIVRKRRIAHSKPDKDRIKAKAKLKRKNIKYNDDRVPIRESKMRRFCNYFMTIFNVRKLNPFVQFIKPNEYKELKVKVLREMEVAFKIVED